MRLIWRPAGSLCGTITFARTTGLSPMTDSPLIERERTVLRDLVQLAEARVRAELAMKQGIQSRNETAEKEYQDTRRRIETEFRFTKEATETEYQAVRQTLAEGYESARAEAEKGFTQARRRINAQFASDRDKFETEYQEACWTLNALWEGNKTKADSQWQEYQRKMAAQRERIDAPRTETDQGLGEWGGPLPHPQPAALAKSNGPDEELQRRLKERLAAADELLLQAQNLPVLKFVKGPRLLGVVALVWLV